MDNNSDESVLNMNNKMITKKYIVDLLQKYGVGKYVVKNLETFKTATTHISYLKKELRNENKIEKVVKMNEQKNMESNINNNDLEVKRNTNIKEQINKTNIIVELRDESYERLEFLGDSVIRLILSEYIYDRFPLEREGFMTKLRTKIESGKMLAELSRIIGLIDYVLISQSIEKNGRENNLEIMEDVLEAFMGALHLDGGYSVCKTFFVKLIENYIDISEAINNENNYKNVLMIYYHKWGWTAPEYQAKKKNSNNKFVIAVKGYIVLSDGTKEWANVAEGIGDTKKKAEQDAAKNALIKYSIVKNESIEDSKQEIFIEEDNNYL